MLTLLPVGEAIVERKLTAVGMLSDYAPLQSFFSTANHELASFTATQLVRGISNLLSVELKYKELICRASFVTSNKIHWCCSR